MADVRAGERALDLACGTGDIAYEIARRGVRVVGLDITYRMVQLARAKHAAVASAAPRPASTIPPQFLAGDMMALPFSDDSFDLVTTGYGIRNVPHLEGALREIHRVLRPGGRVLSLDFNRPGNVLVRSIFLAYLTVVGSTLGFILHGDPDAYRYIPESIRNYPGGPGVAGLMRELGFTGAEYVPVFGGLMAINVGLKRGLGGPEPVVRPGGSR